MFEIVGVIALVLVVLVLLVQQRGDGSSRPALARDAAEAASPAAAAAREASATPWREDAGHADDPLATAFRIDAQSDPAARLEAAPPAAAPHRGVVIASPGVPLPVEPAAALHGATQGAGAGVAAPAPSGFDYAGALAEANPQVVGMVAPAAIAQYPADLVGMRSKLSEGDAAGVMQLARALNGTLGLFKARPALASARTIEQLARDGRCEDALAELARLEPEMAALSRALAAVRA